jgi:peroxiredoxin
MKAKKFGLTFFIIFFCATFFCNANITSSFYNILDNSEPICCENCNDCDKCMVFKIGSRDWKICNDIQPRMSTAPVAQNGRTFLLIRYIAETIGAFVYWDPQKQLVRIDSSHLNIVVDLVIGENKAIVNGKEVQIDTNPNIKPFISGGYTLLPLRFVSDSLGLNVVWVDKTKEAKICYKSLDCLPSIDFELKDTDNATHKLSDYRGKPVLLDFSVSTCIYCTKAMKSLISLNKKYADKVHFLTVNSGEDLFFVQLFKDEMRASWPFLTDLDKSVSKSLLVTNYPKIFILNDKGQIQFIQRGYNVNIENILTSHLDNLLEDK